MCSSDLGHDGESRNGRDIKIDILEAYVWISEVFRVKSGFYRSTGRLPEPPGNLMGLNGTSGGRGEEAKGQPRAPPPQGRIGQGGGRRPPFLSSLSSFPPSPNPTREREGSPTPGRSRTPPACLLLGPAAPPLAPLYTRVGAPLDTQVDLQDSSLSRVRCPLPP